MKNQGMQSGLYVYTDKLISIKHIFYRCNIWLCSCDLIEGGLAKINQAMDFFFLGIGYSAMEVKPKVHVFFLVNGLCPLGTIPASGLN